MSSYKILPKESASHSIIILKNSLVLKVWLSDSKSKETLALRYERKVYETKINPMLTLDPSLPLLKYTGSSQNITVDELAVFLNVKSVEDLQLLKYSIFIFTQAPGAEYEYDQKLLKIKLASLNTQQLIMLNTYVSKIRLDSMILPYIKFTPLKEMLNTCSTSQLKIYIKQIITGIFNMYNNGLVHNDLHYGNVMIDKNDNVLIFDWDRAYMLGEPNPFLNNIRCLRDGSQLCYASQCNILNKGGYAIDLYKILYYIFKVRRDNDATTILSDIFKVHNRWNDRKIQIKIINKLTKNSFFQENGCTYLQYPDAGMKEIRKQFGTIYEIYAKINPAWKNKRIPRQETLTGLLMYEYTQFAFQKSLVTRTITPQPAIKKIEITKQIPGAIKNKKMVEELKYLKQQLADNKKATYGDLINTRKLLLQYKYGDIVPTKQVNWKGKSPPPPVYITTIMQKNDIRKFGHGKKLDLKKALESLE